MTIKQIDSLGRIVIPKGIRDQLRLTADSSVYIQLDSKKKQIVLRKQETVCKICGSCENLIQKEDLFICSICLKKIQG